MREGEGERRVEATPAGLKIRGGGSVAMEGDGTAE